MSPFRESTGGDRRIHRTQVPICLLPAHGSFSRRAVFPDHGPWICDAGHVFDTFWTLNRDPGRWIWRQLHTFDTFSDPGPGPWALDSTTVTHFRHIFWIGSDRVASDLRYRPHFLPIFGPTIWTLGRDPGRWIWRQLHTFDTLGSRFVTFTQVFTHLDRIGSDRTGSDPIVKNPYVWIQ